MKEFPEKKGAIESLKDKLYTATSNIKPVKELDFKKKAYDVKQNWEEKFDSSEVKDYVADKTSFFQKLLIISGAFFAVAILVALFLFFFGSNSISAENVVISVSGPVLAEAGEEVSLQVSVFNRNNTALKDVVLQIRFPNDTRDPDDLDEELVRIEEELGTVREGQRETKTVNAILFGEEESKKEVVISVEYQIDGSTATFEVEKLHTITISSSPVGIRIDAPKEVSAGGEVLFAIEIESNSETKLENLILKASYPFGFIYKDSSPGPRFGQDTWDIGSLSPGEKKEITIEGIVEAQDNEERAFRFILGRYNADSPQEIRTTLFQTLHTFTVARPALGLGMKINGSNDNEVSVGSNGKAAVEIAWKNNSSARVVDAVVEVLIDGNALNKNSVRVADGGFYSSGDNAVRWDSSDIGGLREINPGEGGSVSLEFTPIAFSGGSYPDDPSINLEASVKGSAPSESGTGGIASSGVEREVKVHSSLGVIARSLYTAGPFDNSGPIPPQAEEETTYTVVLALSNSINDLSGVSVEASLPSYVSWVGEVSPSDASVSFNENTRTVTWNAGTLPRSTGVSRPAREAFFKIALSPSISQIGRVPALTSNISASGMDDFAGTYVSTEASALSTDLSTDPNHTRNDGVVVSD
jgi:hypothetical protein